jgi:hypothetical protein
MYSQHRDLVHYIALVSYRYLENEAEVDVLAIFDSFLAARKQISKEEA